MVRQRTAGDRRAHWLALAGSRSSSCCSCRRGGEGVFLERLHTHSERSSYQLPIIPFRVNRRDERLGQQREINLHETGKDLEDISCEIETDFTGTVRMVKQFLSHLKAQKAAAIVNVSSGLTFVPFPTSRSTALPRQACIPSRNPCVSSSRTPGLRCLNGSPDERG